MLHPGTPLTPSVLWSLSFPTRSLSSPHSCLHALSKMHRRALPATCRELRGQEDQGGFSAGCSAQESHLRSAASLAIPPCVALPRPARADTHLAVIVLLTLVSQNGPDHVPGVLDHHLSGINVPFTEEAPAVDGRPGGERALSQLAWSWLQSRQAWPRA